MYIYIYNYVMELVVILGYDIGYVMLCASLKHVRLCHVMLCCVMI